MAALKEAMLSESRFTPPVTIKSAAHRTVDLLSAVLWHHRALNSLTLHQTTKGVENSEPGVQD